MFQNDLSLTNKRALFAFASVLAFSLAIFPHVSFAGTGGDALSDVWLQISDFTQGTLGRILAGLMVVTGLAAGVMRQSLGGFITGLGAGVGLYNAPTVIETMVSATVPVAAAAPTAAAADPSLMATVFNVVAPLHSIVNLIALG